MSKKNKKLWWGLGTAVVILLAGYFLYQNQPTPSIKIFFFKGDKLEAVSRPLLEAEPPLQTAARELIAGPTAKEKAAGFFSEIPLRAKIQSLTKEDGTVKLDFNRELNKSGGGSARIQGLVAQIIYTFTEISGVSKVRITVDKKDGVALGGEGFVLDRPLSREDLK